METSLNCIAFDYKLHCFWLEFAKHVENCNLIHTIFAFYKDGSNLPKRTIWVKLYCLAIQIYQKYFKESEKSFLQNLIEDTWEKCSNVIVSQSEFIENVCKYNKNQTIFDKDWLNWSKWTIWVNPYCPWLSIVRDTLK